MSPTTRAAVGLPIDLRALHALAEMEALERGRAYNALDLDASQRACTEEALRMVAAGSYPARCRATTAEHLRGERAAREALQRPGRRR